VLRKRNPPLNPHPDLLFTLPFKCASAVKQFEKHSPLFVTNTGYQGSTAVNGSRWHIMRTIVVQIIFPENWGCADLKPAELKMLSNHGA
jgi:hypothetical protein